MRFIGFSTLAVTAALASPAAAQQGSALPVAPSAQQGAVLSVVPSDQPAGQAGQEYTLVLVPRTGQTAQTAAVPMGQWRSDQGQAGAGMVGSGQTTFAQAHTDETIENFVRQIYERGYIQGRLAERQNRGARLTQSELEQLGRQLFVRGYVQGRYEESMTDGRGQQQAVEAAQQAIRQARQALREGNRTEALNAMRRADWALPNTGAAGDTAGMSSQAGQQTGSVGRSGMRAGNGPGVNEIYRGAEPAIADRIAPGTVTGHLPIPIPEAQSGGGSGGQQTR